MRNLFQHPLLAAIFLGISLPLFSQETALEANKQEKRSATPNERIVAVDLGVPPQTQKNPPNIVPLPYITTNPTTGFAVGLSAGFAWYMGPKETTSMSAAIPSVMYTTNKQLVINLRGNCFGAGDRWIAIADLRYHITSQPTYGLGTTANDPHPIVRDPYDFSEREYLRNHQMMQYDQLRVHTTGLLRHQDSRFFYGLGYHLDMFYNINDHLLDLGAQPQQITQHYRYNRLKGFSTTGNTLSGVSLNGIYDSRDNVANAYSGRYAFVSWRINPTFIGSTKNSTLLWAEYRDYFNLSSVRPRHLIAWWSYAWVVTTGSMPYMNLPAIGWDMYGRSGRAYTMGRFRGEDLLYNELEYRFPLQRYKDRFGGVVFVNAITASSRTENIQLFDHVNLASGLGLRIMISPKSRSNLAIDYGFATNGSQGFFLAINETF